MADRTSTKPKKARKSKVQTSRESSRREHPKSPLLARNARNGAPGVSKAHPPASGKHFLSDKVGHFTESVIREMTRQAMQHGAVNLAQGFPDFPAPAEIKRAAQEAIAADVNQYAITWGAKSLRNAVARQMQEWQGIEVDPEKEIVVCCGSTEAMIVTLLAVWNRSEEGGGLRR